MGLNVLNVLILIFTLSCFLFHEWQHTFLVAGRCSLLSSSGWCVESCSLIVAVGLPLCLDLCVSKRCRWNFLRLYMFSFCVLCTQKRITTRHTFHNARLFTPSPVISKNKQKKSIHDKHRFFEKERLFIFWNKIWTSKHEIMLSLETFEMKEKEHFKGGTRHLFVRLLWKAGFLFSTLCLLQKRRKNHCGSVSFLFPNGDRCGGCLHSSQEMEWMGSWCPEDRRNPSAAFPAGDRRSAWSL